jgi:hypothetical protein
MAREDDSGAKFMGDGSASALAMREVDQEIVARLAALEALDPSQKRPTPRPNILNRVDFMDWETHHDIGAQPFHVQRTLGFVGAGVWRSRN